MAPGLSGAWPGGGPVPSLCPPIPGSIVMWGKVGPCPASAPLAAHAWAHRPTLEARAGGGEGGSPVALLPLDQSLFPLPSPPATGRVAPALPAAQLGPRHPGASPCPAYSLLEPWHPTTTSSTSPSPSLKGELLGPGPLSSSHDLNAGCPSAPCQSVVLVCAQSPADLPPVLRIPRSTPPGPSLLGQ